MRSWSSCNFRCRKAAMIFCCFQQIRMLELIRPRDNSSTVAVCRYDIIKLVVHELTACVILYSSIMKRTGLQKIDSPCIWFTYSDSELNRMVSCTWFSSGLSICLDSTDMYRNVEAKEVLIVWIWLHSVTLMLLRVLGVTSATRRVAMSSEFCLQMNRL